MATEFLDNVNLNKNQLLNAVMQFIAGDYATPVEGIFWYDSVAKTPKFFDGTTIKQFGGGGAGGDAGTLDGQDGLYYLARGNHTGTQLSATISDFNTKVAELTAGFIDAPELEARVAQLVNSSPATLDTLRELAAALGDNPNFSTDITNMIGLRIRRFAQDVGDGAAVAIAVTHNLGTRDVSVSLRKNSAPFNLAATTVEATDINTVTLRFGAAPALNAWRVMVDAR